MHTQLPRPRAKTTIVMLLLLVSFAATACAEPAPSVIRVAVPTTMTGTFKAVLVAGQAPVAGREPTATFSTDQIEGSTGCNRFGASYQYAQGVIKVTGLQSTLIGCDGAVGRVEGLFIKALGEASSVMVDETGRIVIDGPGGSITFEVGPVLEPA